MCIWRSDNYPTENVDQSIVDDVVTKINALYERASAGGPLHVALDDWNLADMFWPSPVVNGELVFPQETLDIASEITAAMLPLTIGQRNTILIAHDQTRPTTTPRSTTS